MRKWLFAAMLALMLPWGNALAQTLAELPLLPENAVLPEITGTVTISLNGQMLPCDPEMRISLIPVIDDYAARLEIEPQAGWTYCYSPEADGCTVYALKDEACAATRLILTPLPVLNLSTADGQLPTEADIRGQLQIYTAAQGFIRRETAHAEINLRGNTSKRLPKQSYRVKIIHENGENRSLSIAGLRSDDDWILNPMYADTSKIREKMAYELWDLMNSSGTLAASSRLEYAEVFLNGHYWGLYGVQERIDRKQVDGDKRTGVLYKVIANDRPTVNELLSCESDAVCRGLELEFAGSSITRPWDPAAAYLALLSGEEIPTRAAMAMNNVVDYGLWAMLAQAHDCHFKNQFLHCVYNGGGHTIYKIPWDLNNTFGDVWEDDAADTNYTDFRIGSLVMDGTFSVLIDSGSAAVYDTIRHRWRQLRSGAITEEKLITRAREIHAAIFPAIERDSLRWPQCGMGEGNAVNILDVEEYIRTNIDRIDEYVSGLGQ